MGQIGHVMTLPARSPAAGIGVAIVTLALALLCAPETFGALDRWAPAESSLGKIDDAFRRGAIDVEEATLLRVTAITRPDFLPVEYRTAAAAPVRCGTPLIVEALGRRENMTPVAQARLTADLVRPSAEYVYDSPDGFFRIHYDLSGAHAVPAGDTDGDSTPDYVENIADYADSSWRQEVLQYAYFAPPSDAGTGGNGAYDIYCRSIGAYGYAAPESPGPATWNDWTSYVVVHNTFFGFPPNTDPDGNLAGAAKATVAHEFKHSCQFAYDADEASWWMEMTATWMEDEVFDPVNDNYNYLYGFFSVPQMSLAVANGRHEYGSFVWPRFLSEVYGESVVRDIWSECIYAAATTAMDAVLTARGSSRSEAFGAFLAWNWITGPRDDGMHYEEGSFYPPVTIMRSHTTYPVSGQTSSQPPSGLASNYIRFMPPPGIAGRPVKFTFDGDDGRDWIVPVLARSGTGDYEFFVLPTDEARFGEFTLPNFADFDHVVLIPGVQGHVGGNYSYSACIGPEAPLLISPAEGEPAATPVTLEWEATPGALLYRVQVDDDPTFASPESDTSLSTYRLTVPGLADGGTYYWRAAITDACGESGFGAVQSFRPACTVALTGDVDTNGSLNSADVIFLVNYTFKAGPPPRPIPQAGDVNCDSRVTSSDIIYLVTRVFKSGPLPCNVCAIL